MKKTIGLFAHVDAGKTTFAEQLLYYTKSIGQRGRVDHRDAFLDSHDIEKERGITVFADQAIMNFQGSTYYLIDTPGHVDFAAEMERSIQVMDYAILIISAVEGVEGHTETVWQLLRKHHVPTFLFINKTDRVGADVKRVLAEIRAELSPNVCELNTSLEHSMQEELIEFLAERDEALLIRYMDQGYDAELWLNTMCRLIKDNQIFACSSGSALQNIGVASFMDNLDRLTLVKYEEESLFAGLVYKIRYDENGSRMTYIKALSGTLHVRNEIAYGIGEDRLREKVTQIRLINGNGMQSVDCVRAGDLFAVTGLSAAATGDGLGALDEKAAYKLVPTLQFKVIYDASIHAKDILKCFRVLDAEDPSLHVIWNEQLQEIQIHVMGVIQLEVLERLVKERFGYQITFGKPEILYKETIASPVNGCGHFEPLKHYAEVHLKLEPGARGSRIVFANACHPDVLATNYQNLVEQHVLERDHHGLLTGSPVTDMKITLLKGSAHNKHTHGGDFREATYRALRQGLEKAKNIVLEPYYDFKIKVALDHIGRVLSDVEQAGGHFDAPDTVGHKAILTGRVPVVTFMNYSVELASFTQGRGTISLVYGGYDRCHNPEDVIEKKGYNKNADPEYSSSSIFCSKGQGYAVSWDEAERHMHV